MQLRELDTPRLVLDRGRLEANLVRMKDRFKRLNTPLRPHLKTAKCIEVARLALEEQPGGITVSTLAEAEYFFHHGITDIVYAVGIAPAKLEHAASLSHAGLKLTLLLDNEQAARAVSEAGARQGLRWPVLLEVDCDGKRAGLGARGEALVRIGRVLASHPGAELRGVLAHAGGSCACSSVAAIEQMAEAGRAAGVTAAERLRAEGLPAPVVSIGSTPTARFAKTLDGVTEARPGVYMFGDLVMVGLGVMELKDVALSVLASVIGHQPERSRLVIDAGWMALSSDRRTHKQRIDQGYGLVCDLECKPLADLIVAETNQEHGLVAHRDGGPLAFREYPIGTRVRVLPNHACATAAQHDAYEVVDGQTSVLERWSRMRGW